jgi:hypothetical protein
MARRPGRLTLAFLSFYKSSATLKVIICLPVHGLIVDTHRGEHPMNSKASFLV